jgi:hypothetical protein
LIARRKQDLSDEGISRNSYRHKHGQAADVNVNTIRNMEASKDETIGANNQTVVAVQKVLERAGIEFLNHDQPGVRLAKRGKRK